MVVLTQIWTHDDIRKIPTNVANGILKLVKGLNDFEQALTQFDFEQVPSEKTVYGIEHYLSPGNIMTIAIEKSTSEVVGMVITRVDQIEDIKSVALWYLYIAPDYRSKGLGTKLMSNVEDMSKRLGASTIRLSVMPGNLSAAEFYEALGYKQQLVTLAKVI